MCLFVKWYIESPEDTAFHILDVEMYTILSRWAAGFFVYPKTKPNNSMCWAEKTIRSLLWSQSNPTTTMTSTRPCFASVDLNANFGVVDGNVSVRQTCVFLIYAIRSIAMYGCVRNMSWIRDNGRRINSCVCVGVWMSMSKAGRRQLRSFDKFYVLALEF